MNPPSDQTPQSNSSDKPAETSQSSSPSPDSENNSLESSSENSLEAKDSSATNGSPKTEPEKNDNAKKSIFSKLFGVFKKFDIYFLVFIFMLIVAIVIGYVAIQKNKTQKPQNISAQTLDQNAIKQLSSNDTQVGGNNQTLDIQSSTVFGNNVLMKGDLQVAGSLKIAGTLSLPGIIVSGTSSLNQINANSLTLTGSETVKGQLTVDQGINVSGIASFSGSLNAGSISVTTLAVNGDITFAHHIYTTGSIPSASSTAALGFGGTSSVNGTDTAGNVNVNTGSGSSAGCLVNITFAQSYTTIPYIQVTPVGSAAGNNIGLYITRSTSGFSICANNPQDNKSMSFDYSVIG